MEQKISTLNKLFQCLQKYDTGKETQFYGTVQNIYNFKNAFEWTMAILGFTA